MPRLQNVQHIKHSPATSNLTKTELETTFLVKSSTPYVAALKRINKILDKFNKVPGANPKYQRGLYKNVKYITVKGMGKAMEKTLSLALAYQALKYKVDILTGTVEVLDEFQPQGLDSEDEGAAEFRRRATSYVELRIWLKAN